MPRDLEQIIEDQRREIESKDTTIELKDLKIRELNEHICAVYEFNARWAKELRDDKWEKTNLKMENDELKIKNKELEKEIEELKKEKDDFFEKESDAESDEESDDESQQLKALPNKTSKKRKHDE
jgi:hypothetical protein